MRRLALALALVSCAEEGVEKENFTVVIATFWSNQDTQWVWVDSVHALAEGDTMGLAGAQVTCYFSGDSVLFAEDPERRGAYWARLQVAETTEYVLRVASPLGDTVWLEMMSPRAFFLLSPQDGDTLPLDSVVLSWLSGGNRLFYVFVLLRRDTLSDSLVYILPVWPGEGDTVRVELPPFSLAGPGEYRLRVAARDTLDDGDPYSEFDVFWCPGELTVHVVQ